jgi:hypothetical protein
MTKRRDDDVSIEQKIASRRARILGELVKATLAELSPDPEHRAAAQAAFQAALNEDPGQ